MRLCAATISLSIWSAGRLMKRVEISVSSLSNGNTSSSPSGGLTIDRFIASFRLGGSD
jgi:hypothetical protein